LNSKSLAYDKAMMQISKSSETANIAKADALRDQAITVIQRYLTVYEFANDPEVLSAYASLNTLFANYKGLQNWNYEEQSNGLDNFIADLQSDKYKKMVEATSMSGYVKQLQETNNSFKTLFNGRIQESSAKDVFDVKELKTDLKLTYEKMISYVLAMANAMDTEEFNGSLKIINTIRKHYSDMLAKRNSTVKIVAEASIAKMN
jgi:hypothetical protein